MSIFNDKELSLLQIDPVENASLQTLLNNKNISLLQLLSIRNIHSKIKSNLTNFIKHCQKNQDFSFHLIDVGMKSPLPEGSNEAMKQACYIATDVLSCDQDIVAELLILPDKSSPKRKQSGNESEQFEQIEQNIQTEGETSSAHQEVDLIGQNLNQQERFNKKYKYLIRILQYIQNNQQTNIDQNCVNYIIKSLSCLIRKKSQEFLHFLHKRTNLLQRLIDLNNLSSVNQFFIKILSDDQILGQLAQKIKKSITLGILNKLLESVDSQDFAERLDFLEELFQTNKYASQNDRTQLQKLSDIFSSKETINFFYQHMINPKSPTQFFNSTSYFCIIVKRMNVDQEVDPYSYSSNEPKEQTMVFEIDVLFKQFPTLLSKGYENMSKLQYPQIYKQNTMQTRFYELLVLLTKNSRLTNCSSENKHPITQVLRGNNIIFANQQQKVATLKELLKQFCSQSKSGINRINIISLIEKVLNVQIYNQNNHFGAKQKSQKQIKTDQDQLQSLEVKKEQKQSENTPISEKNNDPNQQQQGNDLDEKKRKISKIKAGLKLNIKKFSLQTNEPIEKPQQQVESSDKKEQQQQNIRKLESSLVKDQVFDILQYFCQLLKNHNELSKLSSKKKLKNNETEVLALINKIIMILSNSVFWVEQNEQILAQKDKFIAKVQEIFPFFFFDELCRNYSTTLATNKHPNASARQKTNPQLNFASEFFRLYSKKKQSPVEKPKENSYKNIQLSDSEFKSDDNDEEVHAVKCTLQDFKKFTGFKFESQKNSQKDALKTDRNTVEKEPSTKVTEEILQVVQPSQSEAQEKQNQTSNKQPEKSQKNEQENQKVQSEVKNQGLDEQKKKKVENSKQDKLKQSETKSKISDAQTGPKQKIFEQFYIRHRMIFV